MGNNIKKIICAILILTFVFSLNVNAINITSNSVEIEWETNEQSDSRVGYGLDTSYGNEVRDSSLVTSHKVNLTGLQSDTTYHYRVI